jgi:hypothetical protein
MDTFVVHVLLKYFRHQVREEAFRGLKACRMFTFARPSNPANNSLLLDTCPVGPAQDYSHFQRQLNLYGFRNVSKGPDAGTAYAHEAFLENRRDLLLKVRRVPQASTSGVRKSTGSGGDKAGGETGGGGAASSVSSVSSSEEGGGGGASGGAAKGKPGKGRKPLLRGMRKRQKGEQKDAGRLSSVVGGGGRGESVDGGVVVGERVEEENSEEEEGKFEQGSVNETEEEAGVGGGCSGAGDSKGLVGSLATKPQSESLSQRQEFGKLVCMNSINLRNDSVFDSSFV